MRLEKGVNFIESNIEKYSATLIGLYGTNLNVSNALNKFNTLSSSKKDISINVMTKAFINNNKYENTCVKIQINTLLNWLTD